MNFYQGEKNIKEEIFPRNKVNTSTTKSKEKNKNEIENIIDNLSIDKKRSIE